jgi:hypothetical protein
MAEFARKGTKGAVGKVTAAESVGASVVTHDGAVRKDAPGVDLSLLSAEVPKELDALTEQIKDSHKAALGQMGRAVIAAARAGQLLLAAKVALPKDKAFTEWLAETFEFSQRTAYNYMKVSEAMSRRASEIEQCQSIRDVLKLVDDEDPAKKKKKDDKKESFVTWAAKIERYFADEFAASPIEDWDATRKETCARMLAGVAGIHAKLSS